MISKYDLNDITPQWLAGFFDGEGCIFIGFANRSRGYQEFSLRVTLTQKDPTILAMVLLKYPEGQLVKMGPTKCYQLNINGERSKKFLEDIEHYSVIKRNQIKAGLEYIKTISVYDTPDHIKTKRLELLEYLRKEKEYNE